MYQSKPKEYIPTIASEKLLLEVLIPGICKGINIDPKVRYNITLIGDPVAGRFDNIDVWNIKGYLSTKGEGGNSIPCYGSPNEPVTLITIPRVNKEGLYNLYGELYYIVNRQRLVANIPICSVHREHNSPAKVECHMRSTNIITGESREIRLRRVKLAGGVHTICLINKSKSSGSSLKIPILQYIKDSGGPEFTANNIRELIYIMGFSDLVSSMVMIELNQQLDKREVANNYLLPSAVDEYGEPIIISYLGSSIRAESVLLLYMVCKFLSVECKETDPDDPDDYANKIAEMSATLLSLTIRKILRKDLHIRVTTSDWGRLSLKIFYEICNSLRDNRWSVIDDHNTELQLSRNALGIPKHGIAHALREVVTYRTTVSASMVGVDKYELRQLSPTQQGFICMLVTPDDDNAGLRQYLARDAYISIHPITDYSNNILEAVEDILKDYEDEQLSDIEFTLWLHNNVPKAIIPKDVLIAVINEYKPMGISWNITPGLKIE